MSIPTLLFSLALVLQAPLALAQRAQQSTYQFTGNYYTISYELVEGLQIVRLNGNILSSLVEDLRGFNRVKELIREGIDVRLELHSGGGFQAIVDTLFTRIKEACYDAKYERVGGAGPRGTGVQRRFVGWENKKCTITSLVESDAYCASACIPLFMVGDIRQAGRTAAFGFHQGSVIPGALMIPFMAEGDLKKRGVNEEWLQARQEMFQSLEFTWLFPHEMLGSDIVTDEII